MEAFIRIASGGTSTELPLSGTVRIGAIEAAMEPAGSGLSFTARALEDFHGSISLRFPLGKPGGGVFVPAVWYAGNTEGEGCFPSSRRALCWTFEETRMPLPGIIGMESDGWTFIWMDRCASQDRLASSGWEGSCAVFRFPPHEAPCSYRGKTKLIPAGTPPLLSLRRGDSLQRTFRTFHADEESAYAAYRRLIGSCYGSSPSRARDWKHYRGSKLERLLGMVIRTDDGNAALIMGEGNGEHQPVYRFTAGSFLVKSLEAASAFLRTEDDALGAADPGRIGEIATKLGIPAGNGFLYSLAMKIGTYFLSAETAPGFYQDSISLDTGERGGYLGISEHPEYRKLMNARCTGEAMSAFIELYGKTGHRPFIELPLRVLRFYAAHQLADGSFGRWWDSEGNAIDRKGTNGAYIGTAMMRLLPSAGDERDAFLSAALKAMGYYAGLALSDGFHGDTLDADSVDKEAGVSILAFLLECLEGGYGGERELEAAREAASFILTWVWQEPSWLPPDSPLGRLGFSTEGMTSVSAAHHHLDFYGMLIALLYLRLARLDGDRLWEAQARKMMDACLSLIGCEENGYLGRDASFAGWQPEQINHTSWDYFSDEGNMNGTFGIDIAWVNVLGYSSFLSIAEEFPDILSQ